MDCSIRFTAPGSKADRESEKAVRLSIKGVSRWIPKSLLRGDWEQEIDIPLWFAIKISVA